MKESIPDNSIPIRFAGDEFILLLMSDREADIKEVEAKIQEAAAAFNRSTDKPFRIGLSMGHAVFDPKTTTPDKFLDAIDRAMYINKQERRASGQLKERRHTNVPERTITA